MLHFKHLLLATAILLFLSPIAGHAASLSVPDGYHFAIYGTTKQFTDAEINTGANGVNTSDSQWWTPLYYASDSHSHDITINVQPWAFIYILSAGYVQPPIGVQFRYDYLSGLDGRQSSNLEGGYSSFVSAVTNLDGSAAAAQFIMLERDGETSLRIVTVDYASNGSTLPTQTVTYPSQPGSGDDSFQLSTSSHSYEFAGGVCRVDVDASSDDASWTTSEDLSWIVVSKASGSGDSDVLVWARPNQSTSTRSGTVSIAGQTFSVSQAGRPSSAPLWFDMSLFDSTGYLLDKSKHLWGAGRLSRITSSTNDYNVYPVAMTSYDGFVKIQTAHEAALALDGDGYIWWWEKTSDIAGPTTPSKVESSGGWIDIGLTYGSLYDRYDGYARTGYALRSDGTIWELENPPFSPHQVGTDTNWVSLSVGEKYAVALKSDGSLWTWGYNKHGQLGDGTYEDKEVPTRIGTDNDWVQVQGGGCFTLGIKQDGTLWGWGYNSFGALGDGTTTTINTPTRIGPDADWKIISPGMFNTLGIRDDGSLWTWGYIITAQGDTIVPQPTRVGLDNDWVEIDVGNWNDAFAMKRNGELWAWGYNPEGELGIGVATGRDGVSSIRDAPVRVYWGDADADGMVDAWEMNYFNSLTPTPGGDNDTDGATNAEELEAGTNPMLKDTDDDGMNDGFEILYDLNPLANDANADKDVDTFTNKQEYDAGTNPDDSSSTPDGRISHRTTAAAVAAIISTLLSGNEPVAPRATTMSAGASYSVAQKTDGSLFAWGDNNNGQVDGGYQDVTSPTAVAAGTDWKTLDAGRTYALGVKNDGSMYGWGENSDGQSYPPERIGSDNDWAAVSSSNADHCLALKTNGELYAWGSNFYNALGDDYVSSASAPVRVGSDSDWAVISTFWNVNYAIKKNGALYRWGDGSASPGRIGIDSNWASVSAGRDHVLALKTDGTLYSWSGTVYTPPQVGTDTDWAMIAAGNFHSLALKKNGALYAWGSNSYGQLGLGHNNSVGSLTQVGTDTDWVAVAAGRYFTLALKQNGTLYAWGRNDEGQLGDGTLTPRNTPTLVGADANWATP